MRLLVVEDDEVIGEGLVRALTKEGYVVDLATDGEEGLTKAIAGAYRAIVLDLMLPKLDGWGVCRELRRAGMGTPILMLTARGEVNDKIKGLDLGADDYLPKPFDFGELAARLRALTRRDSARKEGVINAADLEIDSTAHTVRKAGHELHLTPREFELLEALARNRGRVLTREIIIEQIWGDDRSLSNTVNFHVTALRKKIGEGLIETVHGFGYRMKAVE